MILVECEWKAGLVKAMRLAGQWAYSTGFSRTSGRNDGPLLGSAWERLLSDEAVATAGYLLECQVHLTFVQPALLQVVVRH